jgi:transcriptional regulator with XRE-family HTH domain
MQKSLNTFLIKERLTKYGYNQNKLSKELGVSREAVSQWLKSKTLPRPAKLLQLGKLLQLSYNDLVSIDKNLEPKIAFRKKGSAKTTETHIKRAKEMGYALEQLVEFLPPKMMIKPPALANPTNEYSYVQKAVKLMRAKFNISNYKVEFSEIIDILNHFNTILIPVLLGSKKYHENALHIFLPVSATTWVYINLDTKVFDFKFWLTHELGHVLTPNLRNKEAEDFADDFAGAFLIPGDLAETQYYEIKKLRSNRQKVKFIISAAEDLIVSPITIYKEVNKYAKQNRLGKIDLERDLYPATTSFTNEFHLVSQTLFKTTEPKVDKYIQVSEYEFSTIFFELLKKYHIEKELKSGFVSSVLNVPFTDAIEISEYIVNGPI